MAVKDLARRFESLSKSQDSSSSSSTHTATGSRRAYAYRNSDDLQCLPVTSPARFIKHPSRGLPRQTDISSTLPNISTQGDLQDTVDITELAPETSESDPLVPPSTLGRDFEHFEGHAHNIPEKTDSATLVGHHKFPPHMPTPATTLFARDAYPLSLPRLDDYLSRLPSCSFMQNKHDLGNIQMFPPMEKLAASGQTLEDLEANATIPPAWRNRKTILGATVNAILGFTGSSAVAAFYSLQGLTNTVQIFALILSTIVPVNGVDIVDSWRQLFLGTIPNLVALNFASGPLGALIYLAIFMAMSAGLLLYFYRSTPLCDRYNTVEGLQLSQPKDGRWGIVIVTFLLTLVYLPLSTMAVNVLVWSSDLWVVPNYYRNAASFPPVVAPLGPPDEYRNPLDFCWTTTMKKDEINYAPVVIVISFITFVGLTVWFPLALRKVIQRSVPRVDPYTELGRLRSAADMDREYHRLLSRDRNAFAFLYGGFRRGWATYESMYLFAKLSTLFIVAVISSDNCLFRNVSRTKLPIIRQVILLLATLVFFAAQCLLGPFLDPVNNASEWISRLNYLTTAAIALASALDIPGEEVLVTYVLYGVYIITYSFTVYFLIINMSVVHRLIKRLARRVDFSIDIFSPWLDLSPSSMHLKRRIWQETITTLILTSVDCKIPAKQSMMFAQARDLEYPPYLLDFTGSPAERHVENIKILREIGSLSYAKGVALASGPDHPIYSQIAADIQTHFIGPDCYWKPDIARPNRRSFFGNAWWIPFPPTLVMQYDDGPLAILQEPKDLEKYITQNSDPDVRQRRDIRLALRALDGQVVQWPYRHVIDVGANTVWSCRRQRYQANVWLQFHTCALSIKHRGHLDWENVPLGSGFAIELTYSKDVRQNGAVIGLNDDFDLTPSLARFLTLNRDLIDSRLGALDAIMNEYRVHHENECRHKRDTLTYGFLTGVYDRPQPHEELVRWVLGHEKDVRIQQLICSNEAAISMAYERMVAVAETEASAWWYIFWDDFWRRNNVAINSLGLYATDFSPHYPTSIAYTPLPRANLEAFLIQRGLMSGGPKSKGYFHHGLLNKIYVRLNEAVFHDSTHAVQFHLGLEGSEMNMDSIDNYMGQPSTTLGTGGGTDHDDVSLRPRPTYRWEGLLADAVQDSGRRRDRWAAKVKAWLGLNPIWRSGLPSRGISLDVHLENGRYTLLAQDQSQQ